ncbi:MAG: DEAD/DEAH box helicase [Candidatus Thiodiazotropha sp. L084R]
MKYELPAEHSLSDKIVSDLIFKENGFVSLTDAQYSSLEAGLGKGESLLVLSPTSTGKTQIAVWAIANGIEARANTVYLVTHRALAKQKFDDFHSLLFKNYLNQDPTSIVLATGDAVVDCNGDSPADPLSAPLLVATYEKYLAMLSSSGVPSSMNNTVVVCDEIQLLGERSRGQNVEVLLTLMKNAGWRQFIGLSAVLEEKDGADLANWLQVRLLRLTNREKNLRYEYWNNSEIESVCTAFPDEVTRTPLPTKNTGRLLDVIDVLSKQDPSPFPVIVFCMRKADIYSLAQEHFDSNAEVNGPQQPLDFSGMPSTNANIFLSNALAHRIAIHSADLTEEERKVVEEHLVDGKIDVVYATSTLAAGVNFPLGAAIFHKWLRWDRDRRAHVPIDASEFHNMAGRVGRMGVHHEEGKVIYFPDQRTNPNAYQTYLEFDKLPPIKCRINPKGFDRLSLQLLAAGLCDSKEEVTSLICSSFSGLHEEDTNLNGFNTWPPSIESAISYLVETGMVIRMAGDRLCPTPVGKAVAHSGFRPASAITLLNYFASKGVVLSDLLNDPISEQNLNRFAFLIFSAAFSTPEFHSFVGIQSSRFLPWPLEDHLFDFSEYQSDLLEPAWFADPTSVNSAQMALNWISGSILSDQEKVHSELKAGMLLEMYRNLGWSLQGISSILSAVSDTRTPDQMRPAAFREDNDLLRIIRKFPRVITRLSFRVSKGLPDDVLWMGALNQSGEPYRLTREEMLHLKRKTMVSPEAIMLGEVDADQIRCEVFSKAKPAPQVKSNWLRDRCRSWKSDQRVKASEKHTDRAKNCANIQLIEQFYSCRGTQFEKVFESILAALGIRYEKLDDGSKRGAPDYRIELENSPPLIMELKSKVGLNLVGHSDATEVLAAAEIHGYKDNFCITLCHPGVDPSVPMSIAACGRLSVVESHDLGEALLRFCHQRLSQEQLWQWLATPGQALSIDLPFKEH